ncbi:MAG: HAMP domain-containing histidine kinase [Ignavibacteria bacterium]|nr:HAMP domain-containing histidine kinase [Ignavibacteria bacterium]
MERTTSATNIDRVRIGRAYLSKWQIKVVLTIFGLGIIGAVLFFTKQIVDQLMINERRTIELYTNMLARSAQLTNDQDLLFYLDIAYASITFPVIITDKKERPIYPFQQFVLNVEIDSTLSVEDQRAYMESTIAEMKQDYQAFEIKDPDGRVIQKMFYTNSAIVRQLRYLPYVEILIVTSFILVGYVAFSTIRRNEESNIWVGMAKEAAHQLGTPLSSLLAWLEILRLNQNEPSKVVETASEMERDIDRLNIIANRFSKIGSTPNLAMKNVSIVIEEVVRYFETRLPNIGRKVVIVRDLDETISGRLSEDLFEWVIENLIKNAAEAIEIRDGEIKISLMKNAKGKIQILVQDNGKGMNAQQRKRAFDPGFTTKKRGWGLGLSLSKRIVEEYHGGRLTIKETSLGQGTTFCIELPRMT